MKNSKHWWRTRGSALLLAAVITLSAPIAGSQPGAMNETVTFFYYKDLTAAAHFYSKVLGLPAVMDEDWVKIYRITPTSSVGLVLEGHGFHAVADEKPAMLSIVTDEVDAWYEKMRQAGLTLVTELPAADDSGNSPIRGFILKDPGGYTLEFFSWRKAP